VSWSDQFCCYVTFERPGLTTAKEHCGKKEGQGKSVKFHNNKF